MEVTVNLLSVWCLWIQNQKVSLICEVTQVIIPPLEEGLVSWVLIPSVPLIESGTEKTRQQVKTRLQIHWGIRGRVYNAIIGKGPNTLRLSKGRYSIYHTYHGKDYQQEKNEWETLHILEWEGWQHAKILCDFPHFPARTGSMLCESLAKSEFV